MIFDNRIQVTVTNVDRANDSVTLCWQDPMHGGLVEKEMSLKEFVRNINKDPGAKILKPVVN